MKAVLVLFLSGILLSSAYTIGAPQSIPDTMIPSAFASHLNLPDPIDISENWKGTFTAVNYKTGCSSSGNVSVTFDMTIISDWWTTINSAKITFDNYSDLKNCVPVSSSISFNQGFFSGLMGNLEGDIHMLATNYGDRISLSADLQNEQFFSVELTSTTFSFDVDVDSFVTPITQSESTNVHVDVRSSNNVNNDKVHLSVNQYPTADITALLSPTTLTPTAISSLQITTTCNTPPDDYLFTITGASTRPGTFSSSTDSVLITINPNPTCNTKSISQLLSSAENDVNNNQYRSALNQINQILEQEPRHKRAVWLGGISHFNLGDYNSSIGLFRTYTEIAPQDYTGFVELGKSFIALENYNEAINILGIGITLAPPDKQPPINTILYYAQIDYFYQQGGKNVCHPAESIFFFAEGGFKTTTKTVSATDGVFYIMSPNHDFSREKTDVMVIKAINGNNPSEVVQIQFIETGDNTGIFYSNIDTYDEIFSITPDTINFEFGNACTDLLKITIFISGDSTKDSDGDGIFDNVDSCINEKETFNNYQDRDGCPDTIPSDIDVIIQYNSGIPGCEENNSCYSPFLLNINTGDTVVWYNDDDAIKNVSSGDVDSGSDGLFDSGMLLSKEKFEFTFDAEGTFDYYSIIHPWMQGKIVVKYVPLDSDGDGILNENDLCPDEPENYNDFEDDDGCPDSTPAELCAAKYFTETTFDDPESLIDASLKTITCVKFTEKSSNPKVSLPLMILYFWLASAYDELNKSEEKTSAYTEVISYANKILISDQNFCEAYYLIAYSHYKLENYSDALSAIDKAIAIDPNDPDYQDLRNEILQHQEDVKSSSYSVTKINGEVTIIKDRIRNTNPTVNESILVENSVETAIGKINFSNEKAKFTLDEKTHISITASDYLRQIIDLTKGKLYALIEKSLCEGKDCKIITPVSTLKIIGAEFIINYDHRTKITTVYLKEGSIEIFPNEGQSQFFNGPKLIRISNSEILETKEMSNNFWKGEMSFIEFERKITEDEKDFDQWMYFENLTDCENEKDCSEDKAIIKFLIPKSWGFDILADFSDDYGGYYENGDYGDDDFGDYGDLGNFAAYGAFDDHDNYNGPDDNYEETPGHPCGTYHDEDCASNTGGGGNGDYNGFDDYDEHEDDDYGCEVNCQGLIVDKYKNSYRSGEKEWDDSNLLWIGDWAYGEDEFIMVLLEKNNSFKSFGESQYLNYIEKLSEFFCQDDDPIYGEDCTITSSEKTEFLELNHISAYHQKYFVQFEEDDGDYGDTIKQVARFTIIPNGNEIWTFFFVSETGTDWAYAPEFKITENSVAFGNYYGKLTSSLDSFDTSTTSSTSSSTTSTFSTSSCSYGLGGNGNGDDNGDGNGDGNGDDNGDDNGDGNGDDNGDGNGDGNGDKKKRKKITYIEISKKILTKSSGGASFASKYLDKAEPVKKEKVPSWVKNNAKWWSEKQIDDKAFFSGIQFLIKEKIISVSKDLVTKSKSIKFNAEEFTKPTTRGETVRVEISGKVDSFARVSVVLEIQDPNNKTTEQTLVGSKGKYQTTLLLDNESPLGTYNVKVKLDGKIVDIGKFVLKSKFGDPVKTAEDKGIPGWLKNNAKWWSEGLISEDDFIKGIEYLIQNGILTAPVDEEKIVEEKPEEKQTKAFSFETKSLKLDKSTYKLPYTRGMTTMVFVTGEIDDYLKGNPIYLEIKMPDGSSTEQKIRATGAGVYNSQIVIDTDFPTGEYILKVIYHGKIVDAIAFTVTK